MTDDNEKWKIVSGFLPKLPLLFLRKVSRLHDRDFSGIDVPAHCCDNLLGRKRFDFRVQIRVKRQRTSDEKVVIQT
jgi:hypothetical protein